MQTHTGQNAASAYTAWSKTTSGGVPKAPTRIHRTAPKKEPPEGFTELSITATPTSDQAEIPEDDLEVPDFLEQQDVQEDPDEEELPDAAKASSQGGMGMGWGGGVDVGDALRGLQGGLLAVCCKPCVFFDALW